MPTIIVIGILVAVFVFVSSVYADVLWYNQLGFERVFWTEYLSKAAIFIVAFLLMAFAIWISLRLAYRSRPVYAPDGQRQDAMSKYQSQLEPMRRLLMIGIPVVVGVFAATAVTSQWQEVLLFFNQVDFNEADPQFGMDLSFYMFSLPFIGLLNGYLISVVLIAGIAGLLTHYLYGGIRVEERGGIVIGKPARIHIAVFAVGFLLLQAVNFWVDRYSTLLSQNGRVAGALYTDVHAVIPTKTILAIAAVLVAITFIVAAIMGRWRLPIIGTAMLLVTVIIAGGIYPFIVQQYQVIPSEKTLEREFIQKNIDMTRKAYGLDSVDETDYDVELNPQKNALAQDRATTTNIRLLDPNLVSAAFDQLQQFRTYYKFTPTLNVDRYEIDGTVEDTVIGVREVNVDPTDTWVNQHITYTHGYGLVAAFGNRVAAGGRPDFMLSGIPTQGVLASDDTYEPRIYFGEMSPDYSIVGGPDDWEPRELDRPASGSGSQDTRNTFDGDGGPAVGNFFNRLVYSLKFASTDLLLSDAINSDSQILYDRNPKQRVEKVAPYLTVDSNAYPAIVDGRVQWIVDAYTTSKNYPYSKQQALDSAVTDSLTGGTRAVSQTGQINYIRNSVKATVDAYDGSVTLYAWEPEEPLLQAWQKVFPTNIKSYTDMSAELMSHVRYPEDLFKVQRELLATYHVTDPGGFYDANDAWSVPSDPTQSNASIKQPPYYLSLRMPGQDKEAFSLTSTFIPQTAAGGQQRNVLFGFLSAEADAGTEAGVKAEGYGKLRLLAIPRELSVPGPGQAQQNFDSNATVSQALNLLRQGASEVKNGNLLSLPVGGGILYVQPVYVQSSGQTSYPTLRKVLVAFGDRVGFADTLGEALDQVFEGTSGAVTSENGDGEGNGEEPGTPPETQTAEQQLSAALQAANAAITAGQAALAEGDFAKYGEEQAKLQDALERATEAQDALTGAAAPTDAPATDAPAPEAPASETPAP